MTVRARRGMTLIEILVVVGLLLMVAALTIPRLRPEMEKSRVREAARSIQLYLSSAKNLAMSTGRSCGVMIEPLPADNGCAMTLSQVETPVPYGGDSLGCTCTASAAPGSTTANIKLSSPTSVQIHNGDTIQIGYQGYWMIVTTQNNAVLPAGTTQLTAGLDLREGASPAWLSPPYQLVGPYKILRWPVKSPGSALQLPNPAVIDLTWSGNDPSSSNASPTWTIQTGTATPTPFLIMFAADGKVDWISGVGSPGGTQVTTPIYLLVGRRDDVYDNPAGIATTNLNVATSMWVAINPDTGLITVADMAAVGTSTAALTPSSNPPDSRYFARLASANGGK